MKWVRNLVPAQHVKEDATGGIRRGVGRCHPPNRCARLTMLPSQDAEKAAIADPERTYFSSCLHDGRFATHFGESPLGRVVLSAGG